MAGCNASRPELRGEVFVTARLTLTPNEHDDAGDDGEGEKGAGDQHGCLLPGA
jgi:hypothetical protein